MCGGITGGVIGVIGVIVMIITVILSFHYPQYDQIAFVRHIYGQTDTSKVIQPGRIFLDLTKTLVYFPSTAQQVTFFNENGNAVPIYSETGLLFELDIAFIYYLIPENLAIVYNQYSTSYDNIIQTLAMTTIKNLATDFTPDDYINRKEYIQLSFATNVKKVIESQVGVYVPLEMFFFQDITFPDQILNNTLNSVIQEQNNILQGIIQQNEVIISETNAMVANIEAQANYTVSYAQIQANQIIANSISYSNNMAIKANNVGLMQAASYLNITGNDINKFVKVMSLYFSQNPKFILGSVNAFINT
jgi:regulator of protease activity HflC (stomatin/prohibitin superfamily)